MILVDTCSVYRFFFFCKNGVLLLKDIEVPEFGSIKFHKIAYEEFEQHRALLDKHKSGIVNLRNSNKIPEFFFKFTESELDELDKFIADNLASCFNVQEKNLAFLKKKDLFDKYRKELQLEWKKNNLYQGQKKATSEPSLRDYRALYDAYANSVSLVTNDELLKEIAEYFLSVRKNKTYFAEDVIRAVLLIDPDKKSKIEAAIKEMENKDEKCLVGIIWS